MRSGPFGSTACRSTLRQQFFELEMGGGRRFFDHAFSLYRAACSGILWVCLRGFVDDRRNEAVAQRSFGLNEPR